MNELASVVLSSRIIILKLYEANIALLIMLIGDIGLVISLKEHRFKEGLEVDVSVAIEIHINHYLI